MFRSGRVQRPLGIRTETCYGFSLEKEGSSSSASRVKGYLRRLDWEQVVAGVLIQERDPGGWGQGYSQGGGTESSGWNLL